MSPNFVRPTSSFKLEATIYDCDVTGEIPSDLNGAFYRVGPDAQYPLAPGNIPFDGEGHASMFRIKDGRVDYRTRMVKNERWLAQNEAGYRNLLKLVSKAFLETDPGEKPQVALDDLAAHNDGLIALTAALVMKARMGR